MKKNHTWQKIGDWYNEKKKVLIPIFVFSVAFCFGTDYIAQEKEKPKAVTYREYINDLEAGQDIKDKNGKVIEEVEDKIDTVYYTGSTDTWRYTLWTDKSREAYKKWIAEGKQPADFEYDYPKNAWRMFEMPDYTNDVLQQHVSEYSGTACRQIIKHNFQPLWLQIAPMFGSTFLVFGLLFAFMGFYAKKMDSIGGIKGNLLVKDTNVRFKNVIGHDEVVEDLMLIVKLMQAARKRAEAGKKSVFPKQGKVVTAIDRFKANIPRGMLFSGEPGTGKTLLAKAVAGEAGVPFLYMNASGFVEQYVGVGAKRVRQVFRAARRCAPCIVFIDEIDAVGSDRNSTVSGEQKQTINALLQEMDGFDTKSGVFVIAATNTPDALDKALVRSGRFDRKVIIGLPKDWKERKKIFELYLDEELKNNICEADLEHISKECVGFSGADISAACNEARLIAITKDAEKITTDILEEAVDRMIFKGNRTKTDKSSDKSSQKISNDMKVVAYHEAGHALVSLLKNVPVSRATIIGNTSGTGGAVFREDSQKKSVSKKDLESSICITYGGRAAESLIYGEENITTGARSDLMQATEMLKDYVSVFGFDKNFGLLSVPVLQNKMNPSVPESVIQEMKTISDTLYAETINLLRENKDKLIVLAEALLENETLTGEEINKLLSDK